MISANTSVYFTAAFFGMYAVQLLLTPKMMWDMNFEGHQGNAFAEWMGRLWAVMCLTYLLAMLRSSKKEEFVLPNTILFAVMTLMAPMQVEFNPESVGVTGGTPIHKVGVAGCLIGTGMHVAAMLGGASDKKSK